MKKLVLETLMSCPLHTQKLAEIFLLLIPRLAKIFLLLIPSLVVVFLLPERLQALVLEEAAHLLIRPDQEEEAAALDPQR